jgi:hypothetical protein
MADGRFVAAVSASPSTPLSVRGAARVKPGGYALARPLLFPAAEFKKEDAMTTMKTRITEFLNQLEPKRAVAMAIGPGLVAIGTDAGIAHFAGREMVHAGQLIPVLFAPLGCAALVAFAAPRVRGAWFRRAVRAVGAFAVAVGTLGTAFHVRAFFRLMAGTEWTRAMIEAALAVAPPLFAPAAFAGIGVVVWMLGNPRLAIQIAPRAAAPEAAGGMAHAA